jgi:hypothetical protein
MALLPAICVHHSDFLPYQIPIDLGGGGGEGLVFDILLEHTEIRGQRGRHTGNWYNKVGGGK